MNPGILTTAPDAFSLSSMNRLRLVFVGELKAAWAQNASAHYLEALGRYARVDMSILPDAKHAKDCASRLQREGRHILAALSPKDLAVGLDERGKAYSSRAFAAKLGDWLGDPGHVPCFVIGGAYGYAPEVSARFDASVSLGPYTLPHELARVTLCEQLYRAMTILAGHPYHHG